MWHWVDLVIVGIIGLSVLTGVVRGFVKELISLCVWALAIWLAYNHSQTVAAWLVSYIQDAAARTAAAFVLVLLAALITGGIFNAVFSFLLKRSGLSGTDRLLGMGFGFVRGVFLVSLIMVIVKISAIPQESYIKESQLYARFDPVVSWLDGKMPDFIRQAKVVEEKHQALVDIVPAIQVS